MPSDSKGFFLKYYPLLAARHFAIVTRGLAYYYLRYLTKLVPRHLPFYESIIVIHPESRYYNIYYLLHL